MQIAKAGNFGRVEGAGLGERSRMQRTSGPRRKTAAQPWRVRSGEAALGLVQHRRRQMPAHAQPQQQLVSVRAEFAVRRQFGAELPQLVIEKWRAGLDRIRHAHTIHFKVDEVDHTGLRFEEEKLIERVGPTPLTILRLYGKEHAAPRRTPLT